MIPPQFNLFLDPSCCQQRIEPKEYFFSIVASCLLNEAKYYETSSETRDKLISTMNTVVEIDPEFILQVAYYVRVKMYIRSISNFILAFATLHPKTQPFCSTYMCFIILIPGDLIEVCQYTQVIEFYKKTNSPRLRNDFDVRKKIKFSKILQKLIRKKLCQFSTYQLGKQCSESSRKKNLKLYQECLNKDLKSKRRIRRLQKLQKIRNEIQDECQDIQQAFEIKQIQTQNKQNINKQKHSIQARLWEENQNIFDTNFITIKDIVQFSHAKEPRELILSILGRKYPENEEQFKKEFKDQPNLKFEIERAGKRMKIQVPVTWDRELSKNELPKKQIWEKLIQENNIPYLALLRNLKNILKSGVSDQAHENVMSKLTNPQHVQNSKIFPLQYFNALKELDSLISQKLEQIQQSAKKIKKVQKRQNNKYVRTGRYQKEQDQIAISQQLIENYKSAIETAIQISVDKNLDTISGITYVLVDVSESMLSPISGGKKYGSVCQCLDLAFILAYCLRTKCEHCEFYVFAAPIDSAPYRKVDFGNDTLLQGIQRCRKESQNLCGYHEMIGQTIFDILLKPKVKADNVIVLSDMMITQGFSENSKEVRMEDVLKKYLKEVNQNTKFFFMDISGYGQQTTFGDDLKSKNCFLINGMSDNILKYITQVERSNQMQDIVAVKNEVKEKAMLLEFAQFQLFQNQ